MVELMLYLHHVRHYCLFFFIIIVKDVRDFSALE